MWDSALSDRPVAQRVDGLTDGPCAACAICDGSTELGPDLEGAVLICPFCMIPARKACVARLFESMHVQRNAIAFRAEGFNSDLPMVFRGKIGNASLQRLCRACDAALA